MSCKGQFAELDSGVFSVWTKKSPLVKGARNSSNHKYYYYDPLPSAALVSASACLRANSLNSSARAFWR